MPSSGRANPGVPVSFASIGVCDSFASLGSPWGKWEGSRFVCVVHVFLAVFQAKVSSARFSQEQKIEQKGSVFSIEVEAIKGATADGQET